MDRKLFERSSGAVRLRPPRRDDIRWMAEMACDPILVGSHNWGGEPRVIDEVVDELQREFSIDGFVRSESGSLIVQLADGTRMGDVSWRAERWGPSVRSRCPAFGIALLPQFRGHGFGTTAQHLLIDFLFLRDHDIHRVQSDTAMDNGVERHVLRKIGMVEEGVVRQADFRNGIYHDHLLYSLLRPEWEALRAAGAAR